VVSFTGKNAEGWVYENLKKQRQRRKEEEKKRNEE
jgi:hypothetical protein